MVPADPSRVGRYELLLRIGSGGMASVYLARARGLGGFEREVALKVTHPHLVDDPEFVASLLQEARIAARIRHPNVVPVLDVGEDASGVFLVMDYVEGEVLSAIARRARNAGTRVPLPIALRILADAFAGLHAAHELKDDRGKALEVVHRDFSPQNILVGLDGAARLTDFGIARIASLSPTTRSGMIKGKLGYLAPEQVRNPRAIDRRADVWAAGVVAWELVTGQLLHPRDEEAATLLRIVSEEPARARSVMPDLPEAIDDAIAAALQVDPSRRIATSEELRRRLLDAGTPIADAAEVGAYVAAAAGEKLRDRRTKIEATLAQRLPPADAASAPGAAGAEDPEAKTATKLTTTRTVAEPPVRARRRSRRRWAVVAGAGAIAVSGIAVGVVTRGGGTRSASGTSSTASMAPSPLVRAASARVQAPPSDVPSAAASPPEGAVDAASPSRALASASSPSPPRRPPPPAHAATTPAPVPVPPPAAGRPALPSDPLGNGP